MARWTDLAPRQEHTVNQGGSMIEWRGLVMHIAQGSYEGTIAWQQNSSAQVSSHFIVSKAGVICQMVDTATVAWTQAGGNGHWISVENEGFAGTPLTGAQIDANAAIFARVCAVYGVPLQVTSSVQGRGLGHHAMGGVLWGNHPDCPGTPIIDQKSLIVQIAKEGGMALTPQETDWLKTTSDRVGAIFKASGSSVTGEHNADLDNVAHIVKQVDAIAAALASGATVPGLTADAVRAIVREELDRTGLHGS